MDPKGRVIVFINHDEGQLAEVYAVPGHWDDGDIDRFIQDRSESWVTAHLTDVKEVEA